MRDVLERLTASRYSVAAACLSSLVLGLVFVYVWAPHPWGWQGIDAYHTLSRELARGEPFNTTDVPWGYAYFAAAFYVVFGEHVWIPLTAQVVLNALVPLLLYGIVAMLSDKRTATLAALLIGVLSFNTVYASTQSSDAVCTVLFLAALLLWLRAEQSGSRAALLGSGVLFGIAPQFRPNLVLLPFIAAAIYWWRNRSRRRMADAALFLAAVIAVQTPWIIRNYRLTGLILPTSTHGGVQLWYGTLQTGPYLESRASNPGSIFASPPFPYTSIDARPIIVTMQYIPCTDRPGEVASIVYWTDRDREPRRLPMTSRAGTPATFEIPGQAAPTTVYYYLEIDWPSNAGNAAATFYQPHGGAANPYVFFVSKAHVTDLDVHDDLLDLFDLVRATRHLAWGEAPPSMRLDFDHDGRFTREDLNTALGYLLPEARGAAPLRELAATEESAVLQLVDGTSLAVPKSFSGRQTDLLASEGMAGELVSRWRTHTSIDLPSRPRECIYVDSVATNDVFYRREPHFMARYTALAFDNIGRDPIGFALASAYRTVRLFIIRGSNDVATTQQFEAGRLAYTAGTVLSLTYLLTFGWGVLVAWRQRSALLWLVVPIVYVPLTICFVLTNMRYTVTVQPLMFAFVAVALLDVVGRRLPVAEPGGQPPLDRPGRHHKDGEQR